MAKTTQKNIKLTNKENTNNSSKNLLVDNDFKTYEIPQIEKWRKILNKENVEQIKNSSKLTKRNKSSNKKTRKNKKFLGIF
jgi:hypothetical protein